jgi:hypothetical protein
MCDLCANKGHSVEKKYRLSDFFEAHWESYIKSPKAPITIEQYKAVNAIRICRTPVLGVDEYVCPSCGEVIEIYHNCHHRFCPTCSWGDTMKWAEKIKSQMMDIPHRHVVFTVPHALHPLIKSNGKELLNVLMQTSADTFKDWADHKYKMKIGIISVLHTFGETKEYHLHAHMIVSWGGISNETGKLITIKGEYVNFKFLQDKFRIKFEDALVSMYDQGLLEHKFNDRQSFMMHLKQINKKNWILHLEPPMKTPCAVIRYIGRYSKRACISEYKITDMEGEYISFRRKDYKTIDENNKPVERELKLHYMDFFPRLLQHVPFKNFRLVRYYGLYSNKGNIPEEYLNKDQEKDQEKQEEECISPFVCSFCKENRIYIQTIYDMRLPQERIGKFDINIHPSYVYKRAS